ncbi:HPr kinase/phosphorylase [Methylocystis parvus]|uniref:Aldolase n=1 Tax=Methylocystis parvus TaxID=134 RepID=A0A6B8M8J4_9HYPH|nr:HPr kinase/phosphatase C-terminal domain-containing protein [Methylocystis parvus]QGM97653.1 aldolase [Methylocystis parvus]WBJ98412.1 HPr kinase/phosphatase C-terminal domain-containing protein [Methylocystis parvus OBBP]
MSAKAPSHLHANALLLGEKGLLLRGPSGSGKSALTLDLISHYQARGDFARLVGDDRVAVDAQNGRLVARPHPAIAGMIEVRGLGLMRVPFERACVLSAIVDLCGAGEKPPRYPGEDEKTALVQKIKLPRLVTEGCGSASVGRIGFFLQRITTN